MESCSFHQNDRFSVWGSFNLKIRDRLNPWRAKFPARQIEKGHHFRWMDKLVLLNSYWMIN
ncbi:MAG: hypothetical protein H5U07_05945 [Candidatus Aminicenantes bacterium]|nr:hypothetical protein [Candidatus Aminicenantes bacterium]